MNSIPKVPVGAATVTGYGASVVGFVLALVAFLTGDHSQQTVGTIVAGLVGLVALVVTNLGRYAQAKVLAQVHAWGISDEVAASPDVESVVKRHVDQLLVAVDNRVERRLGGSAPSVIPGPTDDTVLQMAKAMSDNPPAAPEELPDDLPGLSEGVVPVTPVQPTSAQNLTG